MVADAAQPTPGPADQGFPKPKSAEEKAAAGAHDVPANDSAAHQPASHRPEGLFDNLQSLIRELPGLVSDRVDLLSLELKRAGVALAQIVVLVVAGAILGITAWLVMWGVIVVALVALGLPLALTLVLVLLTNLGAAAWALLKVRKLVPSLGLPATRRHLMVTPSPSPLPPSGVPDPVAS